MKGKGEGERKGARARESERERERTRSFTPRPIFAHKTKVIPTEVINCHTLRKLCFGLVLSERMINISEAHFKMYFYTLYASSSYIAKQDITRANRPEQRKKVKKKKLCRFFKKSLV